MPPGAFLRHPASNPSALSREVAADAGVAARYSRLFHLSPSMVLRAFDNLRLAPLKHDEIFEVHYVHTGEVIGFKLRRVRKGTLVYAFPDGRPALVQVCGNPLRATAPISYPGPNPTSSLGVPDFVADEPLEPQRSSPSRSLATLRRSIPESDLDAQPGRAFTVETAVPGFCDPADGLPSIVHGNPGAAFPSWILPVAAATTGFMISTETTPDVPGGSIPNPTGQVEQWIDNQGPVGTPGTPMPTSGTTMPTPGTTTSTPVTSTGSSTQPPGTLMPTPGPTFPTPGPTTLIPGPGAPQTPDPTLTLPPGDPFPPDIPTTPPTGPRTVPEPGGAITLLAAIGLCVLCVSNRSRIRS